MYKATLAGVDSGYASLKKLFEEKKIKVSNEKDPVRIYSYEAFTFNDEQLATMLSGNSDKLTEDLIKALEKNPTKLSIRRILAYNSFNETIQLNDVVITFVK